MTPHQQALSDALSAVIADAGQTCVFGAASFQIAFANLRQAQAIMLGLTAQQVAAVAITSSMGATPPTKGDRITISGVEFRVANANTSYAAGKTLFALSLP